MISVLVVSVVRMRDRITAMSTVRAYMGKLTTALLVLLASRAGVPVSTTHVSCGALLGIGLLNGRARWSMIRRIATAWVGTLPIAAVLGAAIASIG